MLVADSSSLESQGSWCKVQCLGSRGPSVQECAAEDLSYLVPG